MSALFDPVNRTTGGTRWGLVSYTVAMFSFVTVYTAINLDILSVSYIDNREFPAGVDGVLPPGPFGYQALIYSRAMDTISNVMFLLNNWLADGLLVGSLLEPCAQVSNAGRPSCTVVVLFMP